MPTYRLDIAYDGSGFHGYARQPGVRTVQGELERALAHHIGNAETAVAGRTDKGVHATAQVVSFATDATLDTARVLRSLNRQLAPQIAALALGEVPGDFHARFSAISRSYRYRILNRQAPDPFLASTSWHVAIPLDVEAMHRGVRLLIGEHDFASFCKRSGKPTVRLVLDAGWERKGEQVDFAITATSFCHQMVRSIVEMCVDIGRGRLPVEAAASILAATDRDAGGGAAPPHGLSLVGVGYPPP